MVAGGFGLKSFFAGGFDCSSQRGIDGVRIDLQEATGHARHSRHDYEIARAHGLHTVRDGLRWHLVERTRGRYCWESLLPLVRSSVDTNTQVIWDLCHYGWPDHIDIWSADFVDGFARYSRAVARLMSSESDQIPWFCPINEISYWAWAGAETARMNPGTVGRGGELKRQLVRAAIASIEAILDVDSRARFIIAEPLINIVSNGSGAGEREAAENRRLSQYEVHDMLLGLADPELGGSSRCIDLVGVNFYADNQWFWNGCIIPMGHCAYRPLRSMLLETFHRYGRPLLISETGTEGTARPYWLHHVCAEATHAMRAGAAIAGLCLYPLLDYPGWVDGRICPAGLFSMPSQQGVRITDAELYAELLRQTALLQMSGIGSGSARQ
ncbi:MAG: hypothetical protein JWN43_834, partial [Gammaproteobacteria bacterium]|nr:hypothetical protein [Gammaproteobacteria bacterium]